MDLADIFTRADKPKTEKWQLGSLVRTELKDHSIVLFFCSDYRGAGGSAEVQDWNTVRDELYRLSALDWEVPLCDLGDLVSGNTPADTDYILQEIISTCRKRNCVPVTVGGANSQSYSLFSALAHCQESVNYTALDSRIRLAHNNEVLNDDNFLPRILSSEQISRGSYHHLAYQKHLTESDSVRLMKEVDLDVVRLAEMTGDPANVEPYFRHADLVTVNCDAVESFTGAFSINPQVNGLNRREICAYMKEAGMSEQLKAVGIFNFNTEQRRQLNHQLLAQMIWHLVEGIQIRKSHPRNRDYETFWIMVEDRELAFHRDVFTDLWYFGTDEEVDNCIPCSRQDFDLAKEGKLPPRLLRKLS
ncbi:MAG: arginase [Chryseobacterium sp.]|nr:MAG: arginase [Chryseobacterium sp.]